MDSEQRFAQLNKALSNLEGCMVYSLPEVESSRTSLASRTHFEVLGLGLEASSPRKLLCPRLEDSTIFWTFEISLENARNLTKNLRTPFLFSSIGNCVKKIFEDLFRLKKSFEDLFFSENTCACVLGPWPWPWAFLFLASRGSVLERAVLGLEPCVLDSTSAHYKKWT